MERREPELRFFNSSEELSSSLADYVYQVSESAVKERGSFSLVLSGGDIPNRLRKLTRQPFLTMVEWSKWHVFWAEENVVSKRHPNSFYRQATEAFISKVPIPPEHVNSVRHGVPGDSAANSYELSIRQQVRKRTVPVSQCSDCPRFDLIILNLGTHCDVAALYPNHPVLEEQSQWVSWVSSNTPPKESITLTLPVINSAAHVAIVASGTAVARPFLRAMMGRKPNGSYPAQLVSPKCGKLVWFADATAASFFPKWQRNCRHLKHLTLCGCMYILPLVM